MYEAAEKLAEAFADDVRKRGTGAVVVTCSEGRNRSALVASLTWMLLDGVSAQRCVTACKSLRRQRPLSGS